MMKRRSHSLWAGYAFDFIIFLINFPICSCVIVTPELESMT